MKRAIAVLRPEPGNRVTAAAIEARGGRAIRLPLFEVRPLAWDVPDAAAFDALLLTSANAVRHAGAGLVQLAALPVHAVGEATAAAARRAGLRVAKVGQGGAVDLIAEAEAAGVRRALHLGGRERSIEVGGVVADIRAVYASDALAIAPEEAARLAGSVALVQSARAGQRLAALATHLDPASVGLVAISEAAAHAAGPGWERVEIALGPNSDALIDMALALAD